MRFFTTELRRITRFSMTSLVLALVGGGMLVGCGTMVEFATREAQPLSYVGQVQFGQVALEEGRMTVPLTYVGGHWLKNSAIVPVDVQCRVADNEIEMTVLTAVHGGTRSGSGRRLEFPTTTKGKFKVYYRDPDGTRHPIGELTLYGED